MRICNPKARATLAKLNSLKREKVVASIKMGIKEWLAPQISEHCP